MFNPETEIFCLFVELTNELCRPRLSKRGSTSYTTQRRDSIEGPLLGSGSTPVRPSVYEMEQPVHPTALGTDTGEPSVADRSIGNPSDGRSPFTRDADHRTTTSSSGSGDYGYYYDLARRGSHSQGSGAFYGSRRSSQGSHATGFTQLPPIQAPQFAYRLPSSVRPRFESRDAAGERVPWTFQRGTQLAASRPSNSQIYHGRERAIHDQGVNVGVQAREIAPETPEYPCNERPCCCCCCCCCRLCHAHRAPDQSQYYPETPPSIAPSQPGSRRPSVSDFPVRSRRPPPPAYEDRRGS